MENSDRELEAYGKLLSLLPEVAALIEYRQSLPAGLNGDERRALMLGRARKLGLALGGDRLGQWDVQPSVLDTCVWTVLREMLRVAPVMYGPVTCRELLLRVSDAIGLDDFLLDYVEETVATGKPGRYSEKLRGGVTTLNLRLPGVEMAYPVVAAIFTPYSDKEELLRQVRDESAEAFRGHAAHEPDTIIDASRVWEYRQSGLTSSQIAWLTLAERMPEIRPLSLEERKTDYGDLHRAEMARIRQLMRRL